MTVEEEWASIIVERDEARTENARLRAALKNVGDMCTVQSPRIGNMHRVESIQKIVASALSANG